MSRISAAHLADVRESLGMDLCRAARKLRVAPRYLAEVERTGADSFALAQRIARLYGIPVDALLPAGRQRAAAKQTGGPKEARHSTAATCGKEKDTWHTE